MLWRRRTPPTACATTPGSDRLRRLRSPSRAPRLRRHPRPAARAAVGRAQEGPISFSRLAGFSPAAVAAADDASRQPHRAIHRPARGGRARTHRSPRCSAAWPCWRRSCSRAGWRGRGLALAAGLIAAVTPLIAFHAQLRKKTSFSRVAIVRLAALDRLRASVVRRALAVPDHGWACRFGEVCRRRAAAGGVPAAADRARHGRFHGTTPRLLVGGRAIAVFALVNAPAFLTPDIFLHGLGTEITHAVTNYIIVWPGWYSHFLFH